nr:MAG TPA: hypothetical protein [Inoviridae sp.]
MPIWTARAGCSRSARAGPPPRLSTTLQLLVLATRTLTAYGRFLPLNG